MGIMLKGVVMDNNIGEARRAYADRVGGFTQEEAAKYFDVALSTYKKWEQGQGKMNGAQLRSIAEKYDVSTDYLLQRSSSPRPIARTICESPEEQEMVGILRSLSPEGRKQLMVYARGCASTYPKNNEAVGA